MSLPLRTQKTFRAVLAGAVTFALALAGVIAMPLTAQAVGATVSGVVQNSEAEPIVGAGISLADATTYDTLDATTSGANGAFSFSSVADGTYVLLVGADNYEAGSADVDVSGADQTGIVITLVPSVGAGPFSLTADLTLSSSKTLESVDIFVYSSETQSSEDETYVDSFHQTTAADHTFTGLFEGSYRVSVSYTFTDDSGGNVESSWATLSEAHPSRTVALTLITTYKITGTVTDSAGAAEGVEVYAFGPADGAGHVSGNSAAVATTAADGTYALTDLSPGKYVVSFSGEAWVSEVYNNVASDNPNVAGSQKVEITTANKPNIDAALALRGPNTVTVTFAAGGVPGDYSVELQELDEYGFSWSRNHYLENAGTTVFRGVPDGQYRVVIKGAHDFIGYRGALLTFTDHEATVNVTLTPQGPNNDGYTISGHLSLEAPPSGDDGFVPAVYAYAKHGDFWDYITSAIVDEATGDYTLEGLGADSYLIEFSAPRSVAEYYDDNQIDPNLGRPEQQDDPANDLVVVTTANRTGIDAALSRADYEVTATITLPSDEYAEVTLQRFDGGSWVDAYTYYFDESGSTTFENLANATYRVKFAPYGIESYPIVYRAVDFGSGTTATVSAVFAPVTKRKVSGVITYAAPSGTAKPLAGVFVEAHRWNVDSGEWEQYTGSDLTGSTGKFFVNLPPGDYALYYNANYSAVDAASVWSNGSEIQPVGPAAAGVINVPEGTTELTGHGIQLPDDSALNTATLTGHVGVDGGGPIAGATVYIETPGKYYSVTTDGSGDWTKLVRPGKEYRVSVLPTTELLGDDEYVTSGADGSSTAVPPLLLRAPAPLSAAPDVTLQGVNHLSDGGVPSVFYGAPTPFTYAGQCVGGTASATLTVEGQVFPAVLTETPAGSGTYKGNIPAPFPYHGDGRVVFSVTCPDPADDDSGEFDIYLDPSGIIVDQYGNPVEGAKVTLLRSATQTGKFTAVPDGSAIMSPANRDNPGITTETGRFNWDVTPGWYKVSAAHPKAKTVTTAAMEVAPERTEIVIQLTVTGAKPPTPIAAPTLSGTDAAGQTLTVDTGDWASDITVTGVTWRVGSKVVGTGLTHVVGAKEVSKLTATVGAYRTVAGHWMGLATDPTDYNFSFTTVLGTQKFTKSPTPTISGTPKVGGTLTAKPGTWAPTGAAFTYQWFVADVPQPDASGPTFKPGVEDFGLKVTVKTTAHKAGWVDKTSATSKATAVVGKGDLITATPTILGTKVVGQTLSAYVTGWGPVDAGIELHYQWLRDGKVIVGAADSADYTLAGLDLGKKISAKVTATPTGPNAAKFTAKTVTSAATGKIGAGTLDAPPIPTVDVSGGVEVGAILTAHSDPWGPSPVALKYQWYIGTTAIKNATQLTLQVPPAAFGKSVTVKVTGTKLGYTTRTSAASDPVGPFVDGEYDDKPTPTISGRNVVGSTLTAVFEPWTPATGNTFAYRWFRGAMPIPGATKSTYKLVADDASSQISVEVSATAPHMIQGYANLSEPTDPILRALTAGTPKITGTAKVGSTLTGSTGTWMELTTLTLQWVSTKAGVETIRKTGATDTPGILTYIPESDDKGATITFRVTGERAGYGTETRNATTKKVP